MVVQLDGRLRAFAEMKPGEERALLARVAAETVARFLRIPVPRVRFFYRNRLEPLNAFYDPADGIAIAIDLSDVDTVRAVCHECRHAWQHTRPEWRDRSEFLREADARCFEASWPREKSETASFRIEYETRENKAIGGRRQ